MSKNVFLEEESSLEAGTKYRKSKHFKKWLLWSIGLFIVMLAVTPFIPPNTDDTNEFSTILGIAFMGLIVAVDHLISGFFYIRGRAIA